MTGERQDEAHDLLAAEFALGLLEGAALREARLLVSSDAAFAARVAGWEARLAPLFDEIPEVEPAAGLWPKIEAAAGDRPALATVTPLAARLRRWRAYGAGMTALAASLGLLLVYETTRQGPPVPVPEASAPMLVATLSSGDTETSLSVVYDRGRSSLLVTPGRMAGAPGHDHELWIIPPGGTPVSLGLVRGGGSARMAVPAELAPHFRNRSAIAVSVEPAGGSPSGRPTGPVIAAGELVTI